MKHFRGSSEIGRGAPTRRRPALAAAAARLRRWPEDIREDLEAGRGFLLLPIALGCGAALRLGHLTEPAPVVMILLAAGGLGAATVARIRLGGVPIVAALLLAGLVGAACVDAAAATASTPRLDRTRTVDLAGFVVTVEDRAGRGQRVILGVEEMTPTPRSGMPARVRVTIRNADTTLVPGDAIRLKARLSPPTPPLVPGGYDFARTAYFSGIGATGFALGRPQAWTDAPPPSASLSARAALERLRQQVSQRIRAVLPGDAGAIAAALIVGDRAAIDPAADEAMRASGLSHVLSISGLHMALVSACLFVSLRTLFAAIPPLALRYPVKQWSAAVALLGAIGYLLVSGLSVPTQRSAVMVAIALTAVILNRQPFSLRLLAAAALVVIVVSPVAVLDPGAQMSFASVAALIAAHEAWSARSRPPRDPGDVSPVVRIAGRILIYLAGAAATALIAGLATAPIAYYHFVRLAPLGIVANLVASPLVAFVIMPSGVAAALTMPAGLDQAPLAVMGWGIEGMLAIAEWTAAMTPGEGGLPRPPAVAMLLAVAGATWLCLWRRSVRLLGLAPLAAGLLMAILATPPDLLVDGEGRRLAIRTAEGRLVVLGDADDFQTRLWLAVLGDGRNPGEASLVEGVGCDRDACILPIDPAEPNGPALVALVRTAAAFADECHRARLVVSALAAPPWCARRATVVDATLLERTGSASFRIDWTAAETGNSGRPGLKVDLFDRAVAASPPPWHARTARND